jgi:hypothetical protein
MPSISASSYATLNTCRRLFYYQQVLHLERAREEGARRFGTMYHKGLEAWWRAGGAGDAPWSDQDAQLAAAVKAIDENARHVETNVYDVVLAKTMMAAYHARYASLTYERIGEGVEEWFRAPLRDADDRVIDKWFISGRKDAFVKLPDKFRVSIVEHKHTSSDIKPGSPYWQKLATDMQSSMYLEGARQANIDAAEVLYDVSAKPDCSPSRATPEEKREFTKGKGCKECGGSAGGKKGIVQGNGHVQNTNGPGSLTCDACHGTGWSEAPRLHANMREKDETPDEFGVRVVEAIAKFPDAHFRQVSITRNEDELANARNNLVVAAMEIDQLWRDARSRGNDDVSHPRARDRFMQNTGACHSMFGRQCDFLPVCSGQIPDPMESPLYQIRSRENAKPGTVRP